MTAPAAMTVEEWAASFDGLCPVCRANRIVTEALRCAGGCDLRTPYQNGRDAAAAFARLKTAPPPRTEHRDAATPAPPADALSRTSPDGRHVVSLRRQPKQTTPALSIRSDGGLIVSEAHRIANPKARADVVARCPGVPNTWLTAALLELSDAWSTNAPFGTQDTSDTSTSPVTTTSDWPDAVDLASVLDEIVARSRVHLYLPEHVPELIALWVAATHTFQVTDGVMTTPLPTMPLFWAFSPTKGCGKSRTMAFLHVLSARSFGSENCSTAAAFRIASKYHPTLIFDEIDTWLAEDTKKEFIGFLNASFTRGGMFTRVVGDDHDVQSFPVYGPRAFAGIGTRLGDAPRSRSARAALEKKPLHIKVEAISTTSRATAQWADPLRSRLARGIRDAIASLTDLIEGDGPSLPAGVEDRAIDAWSPLLAIAEIAGDHWPTTAREACLALTRQAAEQDEDEGDIGVRLLWAAHAVLSDRGTTAITPDELQAELKKDPTAPWVDYRAGQPISTRAIAVLLRRFGIKAHKSGSRRTYELKDFAAPLASYPDTVALGSGEVSQASQPPEASRAPRNLGTDRTDKTLETVPQAQSESSPHDDGYWGSLLADEAIVAAEEVVE